MHVASYLFDHRSRLPFWLLKSLIEASWPLSGMPIMPPQLQRRNGAT